MSVYYNENDPFCVEWLKNLIAARLIPTGDVDARSILDVTPNDLKSYRQCHFFAGIGGWAYALVLADFPADREVWTGSCPCQPFSAAGKGGGFDDERHLWPYWHHLIRVQKPATILGEQVASKAGRIWLDLVHADLASEDYAFGVSDLAAAGVSAPHIRQRLWFVANSECRPAERRRYNLAVTTRRIEIEAQEWERFRDDVGSGQQSGRLGDTERSRLQERERDRGIQREALGSQPRETVERGSDSFFVANSQRNTGRAWGSAIKPAESIGAAPAGTSTESGRRGVSHPWAELEWLPCIDGKARPVELGTFPLAHGIPGRVGRLRAYGNAIVPQVAAEFVKAYLET